MSFNETFWTNEHGGIVIENDRSIWRRGGTRLREEALPLNALGIATKFVTPPYEKLALKMVFFGFLERLRNGLFPFLDN